MISIHPMIRTLAMQPELLADHAGAYLELAAAEAAQAGIALRRRALLAAGAAVLGVAGLVMVGFALLLAAAIPLTDMPAPWALLAVPLGLLLGAGALWLAQQRRAVDLRFALLREQLALDRQQLFASPRS